MADERGRSVSRADAAVGFVGVGTMGMPAVSMLLEAGYSVVACDLDAAARDRARELGAVPVERPQDVAERTDVLLLTLPGPPQVKRVVTGDEGLLAGARGDGDQVIVDMSTVDPETTRAMGARAAEAGVGYLDAPILGRPSAAGHWVLPVGGPPTTLERCRPVLGALASKVLHVGPLGSGNKLKLLNALMFSAINAITAEMMAISRKAGFSPEVLFGTIAASEAATVSGLFKELGPKIVARDFAPVFPIDLLCKDNGLAIEMARGYGAPPVVANAVQVLNELAQARGLGGEDTSALVKVYEALLDTKEDAT
jgi:3-hydroxyisobutyrate dehydrogenase-like beta-hydroxyacid dehydrogenase